MLLQSMGLQIDCVISNVYCTQQVFIELQHNLLFSFLIDNDLLTHLQLSNEILFLSEPCLLMENRSVCIPFTEV